MTDLVKNEKIKDKTGNHYRFVSLETTQEEADAKCLKLVDSGFQAANSHPSEQTQPPSNTGQAQPI